MDRNPKQGYSTRTKLHTANCRNIGPLVKCMCNDMERVFFKSNKHWREGIDSFIRLIYNIIFTCWGNSADKKIVQTLLQKNEVLLTSIIQWGHWEEKNRPDIVRELNNADECKDISVFGNLAMVYLITDVDNFLRDDDEDFTGDGKEMLKLIGTTPVVSNDYDPKCKASYVVGLIQYLKTNEWEEIHFDALICLIIDAGCVDKEGVITEIIDWGVNYVADINDAVEVARVSHDMVLIVDCDTELPCDTRTAFAIRTGLVEMCLGFIDKFGKDASIDSKEDDGSRLFHNIGRIFQAVNEVSLHLKTAKSIRSKRVEIEKKLGDLQQNTDITDNSECKKLLDMIRSILDINGSYCCRCNKSLSRTEVKQCNGCHRLTYCSRICQREDWLNSHSVTCCTSYTHKLAGQFQGRCQPTKNLPERERAAAALKELEVNVSMIQLKLFLDNSETILRQAEALGLPLYDCLVCFDLRCCPLTIKILSPSVLCKNPERMKGFEETLSKKNITCMYNSYILNG